MKSEVDMQIDIDAMDYEVSVDLYNFSSWFVLYNQVVAIDL